MTTKTNGILAKGFERIGGIDDLPGAGQIVVQGNYAYVGHMERPHGTSIIDVSDPRRPKVVATIEPPAHSHTHKVRIAGDLMYTNVEMDKRHFLRKGEALPALRESFERQHGRAPEQAELARLAGVEAGQIAELDAARERGYNGGGWRLWDVSDRTSPQQLSYTRTHGFGTHRFDADERYAYISTEMEGYVGNILVIYDCADPIRPEEVSRWWMPGQHLAGGRDADLEGLRQSLAPRAALRRRAVGGGLERGFPRDRRLRPRQPAHGRVDQLPSAGHRAISHHHAPDRAHRRSAPRGRCR
jgi:hypothetical protein